MMIKCKLPNKLLVTTKQEVVVNVLGYGEIVEGFPVFRPVSFTFHPLQYMTITDQVGVYNFCMTAALDAYKQLLNQQHFSNIKAQA